MKENLSEILSKEFSTDMPKQFMLFRGKLQKTQEIANIKNVLTTKLSKKAFLFAKFEGHCAYCGESLLNTAWNIDHIKPKSLGGTNAIENLNPSCCRCNTWKKSSSIEGFRNEIISQSKKLLESSAITKLVVDYGIIEIKLKNIKPKFYFELLNDS